MKEPAKPVETRLLIGQLLNLNPHESHFSTFLCFNDQQLLYLYFSIKENLIGKLLKQIHEVYKLKLVITMDVKITQQFYKLWTHLCVFRSPGVGKDFEHCGHLCGLS